MSKNPGLIAELILSQGGWCPGWWCWTTVSQVYLDEKIIDYFSSSEDEDHYGEVRMQPCMIRDDLIRSTNNFNNTRNRILKLEQAMKEMALEIHPTKVAI